MKPTTDSVLRICKGENVDKPLVQVLKVGEFSRAGRAPIVVSDGKHYIHGQLDVHHQAMVLSKAIGYGTMMRIDDFNCPDSVERKILVVLRAEPVGKLDEVYGRPENVAMLFAPPPLDAKAAPALIPVGNRPKFEGGIKPGAVRAPAPLPITAEDRVPISQLHPFQSVWSIRAKCVHKSDVRSGASQRGPWKMFNVHLLDESAKISATMWRDAVDKFFPVFQVGKTYTVSRGQYKPVRDKKWSTVQNDHELTLDVTSEVTECSDGPEIKDEKFEIRTLQQVAEMAPQSLCDVCAIVRSCSDIQALTSKAGKDLRKRTLTLVDHTNCQIELTLWNEHAEAHTQQSLVGEPVLVVGTCQVSDFAGCSLQTTKSSRFLVNPDMPEAKTVKEWWSGGGKESKASSLTRSSFDDGTRVTWEEVKSDPDLGYRDHPDYFSMIASVSFIDARAEKPSSWYYTACPAAECKNRGLTDSGRNTFFCASCQREFDEAPPRFVLRADLQDSTGTQQVTLFDEHACKILGGTTAKQLVDMLNEGKRAEYEHVFSEALHKRWLFRIKAQFKDNQGEQRLQYQVVDVSEIDYAAESERVADEIKNLEQSAGKQGSNKRPAGDDWEDGEHAHKAHRTESGRGRGGYGPPRGRGGPPAGGRGGYGRGGYGGYGQGGYGRGGGYGYGGGGYGRGGGYGGGGGGYGNGRGGGGYGRGGAGGYGRGRGQGESEWGYEGEY